MSGVVTLQEKYVLYKNRDSENLNQRSAFDEYQTLSDLVQQFKQDLSSSNIDSILTAYHKQNLGQGKKLEYSKALCGMLVKLVHKTFVAELSVPLGLLKQLFVGGLR